MAYESAHTKGREGVVNEGPHKYSKYVCVCA